MPIEDFVYYSCDTMSIKSSNMAKSQAFFVAQTL